jgi:peptidyl-prolyl cis-trans isomerase A (cyclophilin A)
MTPNFLIVLPDLVLAGRLQSLIPHEIEATVGFAASQEDGILALNDYTHLDLCVFCLSYPDGDGLALIIAVKKKFPRARLVVVTDLPPEVCGLFDPSWVALNLPLDAGEFAYLCRETLSSMQGSQLGHFTIGSRFRSDCWGDWYKAYDTTLKREVDLGILHSWATPEESSQFREAASLRAQAAHDHVQTVYFGGDDEGRSFVSHEKWEMPTLPSLVGAGQKIDARTAARILHTVAAVLTFWDSHQYPHPPLETYQITLSPYGVVKVENIVDPTLPFRPMKTSDLIEVANAVYALLPSLEKVPRQLRGLLNKLRAPEQVIFETSLGDMTVLLDSTLAPITVANFLAYVDREAYDGTLFHHVISGFVAQGGRYMKDMTALAAARPIPNEASNGLLNRRGTLSMAHGKDADGATSQFIFNLVDNSSLDPNENRIGFAVFGKVIRGMEVLDRMAKVEVINQDKYYMPVNPVILFKVRRSDCITVAEVLAEAQALDLQLDVNSNGEVTPGKGRGPDSAWLRAMTSTDKALASMSKAILTLSGSLTKKSSAPLKKSDADKS